MENNFMHAQLIPPRHEPPKYDNDCELLDICDELGATYKLCYKGASLIVERCTPAQKQAILQGYEQKKLQIEIQDREDKRQAAENELQLLRDKQAVRRSWVQLLVAAVLGGIFAKLFDWIPMLIEWIKALSK